MARLLVILFFLLIPATSCMSTATPFSGPSGRDWAEVQRMDLMVQVENHHFDPVKISAVWPNQRFFLGEVLPGRTETFRIPGHVLEIEGGPRFLADPVASTNEQLTEPVNCEKARLVRWRLKRHLVPSRPVVLSP
jgi:hypothetical protein